MSLVDAAKEQLNSAILSAKDKALWTPAPLKIKKQDAGSPDLESGLPPSPSKKKPVPGSAWAYLASWKWVKPMAVLAVLYSLSLLFLLNMFWKLPSTDALSSQTTVEGGEHLMLKLPTNFQEASAVKNTLELYKETCSLRIIVLMVCLYLFLQVFMMPGAIFINVLAGSLYGLWGTFLVIAGVSTLGASLNYWLSRLIVREVLLGLFPGRTDAFAQALQKHKHHLVNYMIFMRVTPLLPSWFINTASPVVGFPFREYIIGTAVGLQPLNFILVQAGQTLATLQSWRDLYNLGNIAKLGACALLAVSPVVLQRCLAARTNSRKPSFSRPRVVRRTGSL